MGAVELLDEGQLLPVLASLKRDGQAYLWVVEAPFPTEQAPTLEQPLLAAQRPAGVEDAVELAAGGWEKVFGEIFRRAEPPRWVLLLAGSLVFLVERHKWGQGKYLLFDIDELLGRKETDALKAACALLHRDVLCPDDGTLLHDTLDENSHKHAFAVSGDLKYGVRRAVELHGAD